MRQVVLCIGVAVPLGKAENSRDEKGRHRVLGERGGSVWVGFRPGIYVPETTYPMTMADPQPSET